MASLRSAVLLATAVVAAGCTADSGDNALLILNNKAPETGCAFTTDTAGAVFSSGRFDIAHVATTDTAAAYLAAPLVQNLVLVDGTAHPELLARRTAIVKGAHVTITFTDSSQFSAADQAAMKTAGLTQFDARFAGTIAPNGGLGVFPAEIVPNGLLQKIKTYLAGNATASDVGLIASLVVFADLGGSTVESAPFEFPIDVCDGCLTSDRGPCSALPSTFMARTGGVCDPRQDGVVDCCTDATGNAVCPAVGSGGALR
jgi:hypothetical protein